MNYKILLQSRCNFFPGENIPSFKGVKLLQKATTTSTRPKYYYSTAQISKENLHFPTFNVNYNP